MKKSLLAVAVAAAMPVLAQAQTNVTMYGIADAGAGAVKSGIVNQANPANNTSTAFRVDTGIQSTSRWGVRGSEDLGGGLSAIFNAEAQWNVDDGTGNSAATQTTATANPSSNGLTFDRRSFVGLQGGFGQIYFGRDYTPAFFANIITDVYGYGMNGSTLAWAVAGYSSIRFSNAVFYNTPTWGGLQIRTAYGHAQGPGTEFATASKKRDTNFEIAAIYNSGAILGHAYYRTGWLNAFGPTAPATVPTSTATAFITSPAKIKQYGLGAGYNFGPARLVAGAQWSDPENFGVATDRVVSFNVGVGVRAGAGEVMFQVNESRYATPTGSTLGKPKNDTFSVAYTYPLSKRTNLYGTYAYGRNVNNADLGIRNSGNSYGTMQNGKPQALAFGIRHQF